jgi:hypothetical protein
VRNSIGMRRVWKLFAAGGLFPLLAAVASAVSITNCSRDSLVAALSQGGVASYAADCALVLTAPIPITNDVALTAAGFTVTLSATNSRIFEISAGVDLIVNGITFASALSTNGGAFSIPAQSTVTLVGCRFSGNLAVGPDGFDGEDADTNKVANVGGNGTGATAGEPGYGGAIYNLGWLSCLNCTFVNNRAFGGYGGYGGAGGEGVFQGGNGGGGGAGAAAQGGAIYNLGELRIDSCTFSSNSVSGGNGGEGGAAGGGAFTGLAGKGGAGALGSGGAIWSSNIVAIVNSSLTYNLGFGGDSATAGSTGGTGSDGAKGGEAFGGAVVMYRVGGITNSTLYGNYLRGGMGGKGGPGSFTGGKGGNGGASTGAGICNFGTVTVMSCTLSGNGVQGGTNGAAGEGPFSALAGSIGAARGANLAASAGTLQLKNTILGLTMLGPSGYGTVTDLGRNISADTSLALSHATSLKNTNPKLGTLATNGGSTVTILPQPGSPAANRGDMAGTLARDQRGLVRPSVGKSLPDIGAVEGQLPAISTQPADLYLAPNAAATLTVVATGEAPLLYRWNFRGTNLPAATATNATLSISALSANQFGPYFVIVSNAFGAVTSRVATLYPLPVRPLLSSPTVISNQFVFTFISDSFFNYRIEYKDQLTDAAWKIFSTYSGTGSSITNRIPIGTVGSGFYRVVSY